MNWKDTTSHSQGDKVREPSSWETKAAWLTIVVHRHIDFEKDRWLLSTKPRVFDLSMLESKDIGAAKREAMAKIKADLATVVTALEKIVQ